jgi:hypothetical protein
MLKKSVSLVIATILLIVISVILITVVLTWGSDFAKDKLSIAQNSAIQNTDFTGLITTRSLSSKNILISNNHSSRDLNVVGYKIISSLDHYLYDYFENKLYYLEEPLIIGSKQAEVLQIDCYPEESFFIDLLTDQNTYVRTHVLAGFINDINPLSCGLISYWKFDGDAKDYFKKHDLSVVGNPQYVDGVLDQALSFTNSSYARNSSFYLSADPYFTISTWVKKTDLINQKGVWGIGSGGYETMSGYNSVEEYIGVDFWARATFYIQEEYPIDEWIYVTWVKKTANFSIDSFEIYLNGNKKNLLRSRGSIHSVTTTNGITIGGIYPSSTFSATAVIDDFKIYDRALTSKEVLKLYDFYNS